jgi:hypothetical protein
VFGRQPKDVVVVNDARSESEDSEAEAALAQAGGVAAVQGVLDDPTFAVV